MESYKRRFIFAFTIMALVLAYSSAYAQNNSEKLSFELMEKSISSPESNARVIIKMKAEKDLKSQKNSVNSKNIQKKLKNRTIKQDVFSLELPLREISEIALDENIEYIREDKMMRITLSDSVPIIGAEGVWNRQIEGTNITGKNIAVCIIDTGVDYTHPDLGNCTNETFVAGNCSKVISGYDFVNSDNDPVDDHGHGTHVAGIVAANGTIKGVAPGARIIAIKALNSGGSGYESDVISGIDWCVSNSTIFNITAISMSLGGEITYSEYCDNTDEINALLAESINAAIAKNISVVVATGNNGSATGYSGVSSPACIQNATRVTAVDKSDNYAGFAERGTGFEDILSAPGVSITSTYLNSGQAALSGTSMATPHVSGAIALLSEAYKKIYNISTTSAYLKNLFNATGKHILDSGKTNIAFARINVSLAYEEIASNPINIIFPLNGTFLAQNFTEINASQKIEGIMNYSLDNGQNVSACISCTSFSNSTVNLSDGLHNVTVYGNNSAVGLNSTSSYFTVDTTYPKILFENNTEENNTYFARDWIFANVSVNDTHFLNTTFFIFNSSGSVNETTITDESALQINWTELLEGVYFFNISASDKAGNLNTTEMRKQILDRSPPQISNVIITPPIAYQGQNVTITYSATDLLELNSSIKVSYGNFSEYITPSKSGETYDALFQNTSNITTYNITIFANDSLNHTTNASASFIVKPKANISFNFITNASLTLRILYNDFEITNISSNTTEERNASIGSENYTVKAQSENENFHILFEDVELSQNTTIDMFFSNITAENPHPSKYRFTNISFSFSPNITHSSANVCFDYTEKRDTFSNISRISNFKCNGLCEDNNWSPIPTTLNISSNQSCSIVSSFSSFVLGEILPFCGDGTIDAGETCSNCPQDAGTCPQQSSSGNGGRYWDPPKVKKNITNTTNITVAFETERITVQNNTTPEKRDTPKEKITGLATENVQEIKKMPQKECIQTDTTSKNEEIPAFQYLNYFFYYLLFIIGIWI